MPVILFEAVADIGFRVLASAMKPDQTATAKNSVCIVWLGTHYNTLKFKCKVIASKIINLYFINLNLFTAITSQILQRGP